MLVLHCPCTYPQIFLYLTRHLSQISLSSLYSLPHRSANVLSLKAFLYFKSLSFHFPFLSRLSKPLQSLLRLTSYTILKILFNPPDQANTVFLRKVWRKLAAFIQVEITAQLFQIRTIKLGSRKKTVQHLFAFKYSNYQADFLIGTLRINQ